MRVVAICRGAPGLGRVVPSLVLVTALAEAGPVASRFASYGAGARYLAVRGEKVVDLGRPDGLFIDAVAPQALHVRKLVQQDRPDLVLVDGEFYLPATLADLDVPVIYLANPHDLIGAPNVFRRVNRLLLAHADAVLISSLSCIQSTAHPDLVADTPCLEVPAIAKDIPLSHRHAGRRPRVLVCAGGGSIGGHPTFRSATDAAVALVLDALCDLVREGHVGTVSLIRGADAALPNRWQTRPRWLRVIDGPVELADLYPHHDLLVARAGRNTTAEAAFCGIPTVLLPITTDPHRGDEQADNADALAHLPGIFPLRRWHDITALRQTLSRALVPARQGIRVTGQRGNDSAVAFILRTVAGVRRPLTTVS